MLLEPPDAFGSNRQEQQPKLYGDTEVDGFRSVRDESIPLVAQPPPQIHSSYAPILPSTPMFSSSSMLGQKQQQSPTIGFNTAGGSPAINSMDTEAVLELKQWLTNAPELLRQSMLNKTGEDAQQQKPSPQQQPLLTYTLPNNETINCVCWRENFFITGTDIVKILLFRFASIGRPVLNAKKFEEGVFSDLRNLKPGTDAVLEEPRSAFLEFLYRHGCIRTQKKQKVFYWYRVTHDDLFMDALERDLKREANLMQMNSFILSQRLSKQMAMNISMAAAAANTVNPAAFAAGGPNSMAAMMMGDQHVNGALYPMMIPGPPAPNIMPNSHRQRSASAASSASTMQQQQQQQRRSFSMYPANLTPEILLQQQFQQQGNYTNPASPCSSGYPSSTLSSPGPTLKTATLNTAASTVNPLMQQHQYSSADQPGFALSDFQEYPTEYQNINNHADVSLTFNSADPASSSINPNMFDYNTMFADFM